MTLDRQKDFERTILQGFLNHASIPAVINPGKFEAPDALITIASKNVGVEITEIQKSRGERRIRSSRDDLLRQIKQHYDSAGGSPICATFYFRKNEEIRRPERKNLGERIAEIIVAESICRSESVAIVTGAQLPAPIGNWLHEIRFWKTDGSCIWQISEASWVAPLTSEILQERVEAKARCLPSYRLKGYAEYWLLICADPMNPACRFDPARDFDPKKVISPFDRTFFYDAWHLIELG